MKEIEEGGVRSMTAELVAGELAKILPNYLPGALADLHKIADIRMQGLLDALDGDIAKMNELGSDMIFVSMIGPNWGQLVDLMSSTPDNMMESYRAFIHEKGGCGHDEYEFLTDERKAILKAEHEQREKMNAMARRLAEALGVNLDDEGPESGDMTSILRNPVH